MMVRVGFRFKMFIPSARINADTLFIESVGLPISGFQFRCLVSSCTYTNAVGLVVIPLPSVSLSQFPGYFCFKNESANKFNRWLSGRRHLFWKWCLQRTV